MLDKRIFYIHILNTIPYKYNEKKKTDNNKNET